MTWLAPRVPATILLIDSNPTTWKLFTDWLRLAGYHCLRAGGGAEAMIYLEMHEVQLALLSISLQEDSFPKVLAQLKSKHPGLPVLMLANSRQRQAVVQAMDAGAYGYVTRPVQREELLAHIRHGLEWRQLWLSANVKSASENDISRSPEEAVRRLVAATICRDEETGEHIVRTGLFSEVLAKSLGWSDQEAARLRFAASLHDVGKIGIPDAILQKPARLTKGEYEVMKQHTIIGAKLLSSSQSPVFELARQIALSHHERWNGTGYPSRLSTDQIPSAARIVAIVDVYDALTHDRVYRPAYSTERALAMMRAKQGTHFDPLYLAAFITAFDQIDEIAQRNPDVTRDDLTSPSRLAPYANVASLDKLIHRLFDSN